MKSGEKLKSIYYKFLLEEMSRPLNQTFFDYLRDWKYKSATWQADIIKECSLINEIEFHSELDTIIDNLDLEILIRCEERERAKKIAYEFMNENREAYKSKLNAGNDLAFISEKLAEECRYVGNAISGGNALSAALGETLETRVRKQILEKGILQ